MIKKFYKFTLTENYEIQIPAQFPLPDFENEWVRIVNNHMTVKSQYSWDGNSPKRIIFNRWIIGTWDGPINQETGKEWCYYASLIHDVLCQFKIGKRKISDQLYRKMLGKFVFKHIYYFAVRTYGTFFDNF